MTIVGVFVFFFCYSILGFFWIIQIVMYCFSFSLTEHKLFVYQCGFIKLKISFETNPTLATSDAFHDVTRKTHDLCFDWSRANLSYVTLANMARGFAQLTKSTPCIKRIEDVVYLAGSRRILF